MVLQFDFFYSKSVFLIWVLEIFSQLKPFNLYLISPSKLKYDTHIFQALG